MAFSQSISNSTGYSIPFFNTFIFYSNYLYTLVLWPPTRNSERYTAGINSTNEDVTANTY